MAHRNYLETPRRFFGITAKTPLRRLGYAVFPALCSVLLFLTTSQAFAVGTPATITLAAPTQVPGMTLDPGSYSIRVIGTLSDRVILKIADARGKTSVDFLGVPNPSLKSSPGITS